MNPGIHDGIFDRGTPEQHAVRAGKVRASQSSVPRHFRAGQPGCVEHGIRLANPALRIMDLNRSRSPDGLLRTRRLNHETSGDRQETQCPSIVWMRDESLSRGLGDSRKVAFVQSTSSVFCSVCSVVRLLPVRLRSPLGIRGHCTPRKTWPSGVQRDDLPSTQGLPLRGRPWATRRDPVDLATSRSTDDRDTRPGGHAPFGDPYHILDSISYTERINP
jgi:hypothetical protein